MAMGIYEGGQNWDGAAFTLVEQAKLPFVNPLEMNNPDPGKVVLKVRLGVYADLFRTVCGKGRSTDEAYECIAEALAAYQSSAEVNQFSSKYDHVLAGTAQLSEQEARGLALFSVSCARCHRHQPASDDTPPMFTSRHHANVGVPRNPENPFYGMPKAFNPARSDYVDPGTGGVVGDAFHFGRVKIPTLRNVAVTAPYMHNGALADLETVVHFYNTRDVAGAGWPAPEWNVAIIKAPENLGDLGLTSEQEDDIVAFLQTLTDGYTP
jgi:cytochrome c peroxidase